MTIALRFSSFNLNLAERLNASVEGATGDRRFSLAPGCALRIGRQEGYGDQPASFPGNGSQMRYAVDPDMLDLSTTSLPQELLVIRVDEPEHPDGLATLRATCRTSRVSEEFPGWRIASNRLPRDATVRPNTWVELFNGDWLTVQGLYGLEEWRDVLGVRVIKGCQQPAPSTDAIETEASDDAQLLVGCLREGLEVERIRFPGVGRGNTLTAEARRLAIVAFLRLHNPLVSYQAIATMFGAVMQREARERARQRPDADPEDVDDRSKRRVPKLLEIVSTIDQDQGSGLKSGARLSSLDWGSDKEKPWAWVDRLIRIGVYREGDFPAEWNALLEPNDAEV